jgi:hypothetical protein
MLVRNRLPDSFVQALLCICLLREVATDDNLYAKHPVPLPPVLEQQLARGALAATRIAQGTYVHPVPQERPEEDSFEKVSNLESEPLSSKSAQQDHVRRGGLVGYDDALVNHGATLKYRELSEMTSATRSRRSTDTTEITEGDIESCTRYEYIYRELGGAKPYTLNLGKDDDMSQMNCIVDVKNIVNSTNSSDTETTTVVINAAKDTRNLQWRISMGRIEILDLGGGPAFRLTHIGIGHYVINFGTGDNEVIHFEATSTVVAGLFFPSVSSQMTATHRGNLVRIYKNKAGIFISGNTDVQIGLEAKTGWSGVPSNPFDDITSVIAIAGSKNASALVSKVILETGKSNIPHVSPSQAYGISQYDFDLMEPTYIHLDLADPHHPLHDPTETQQCYCPLVNHSAAGVNNSASSGPLAVPSPTMCQWMIEDGGFGPNACSGDHRVVYTTQRSDGGKPRVHFDITSGESHDLFCASNSTASLTFNAEDGMDEVCVSSMNPKATGAIDVGTGADMVYLVCPLTNTAVILGQDTDPDLLGVFYQTTSDFMPEWMDSSIENVGPAGPDHKITVTTGGEWQDRLMVKTIA